MRVLSVGFSSRISRSLVLSRKSRRCLLSTSADSATDKNDPQSETKASPTLDDESKKALEDLQAQIAKLEESAKDKQDKYMRALAEAENVRTRMTKQVEDAKLYGIQGFCKDLLEVSDILRTAIGTVPKEELTNANPHLVSLFEGLNMTESQLVKVFKKHGLDDISPSEGDKFDPNIHEALFQVPIQSKDTQVADTIAIVQKVGFRLHTRTLRPALVGVFKS